MNVPVYWIIDRETDQIIGSTHTPKSAKTMASEHDRRTHHLCRVKRVLMSEDHTTHDAPAA